MEISPDVIVDIARNAIWIIIKASAPMLLVSLIVGLIISIFQTVTSIQEQTLTFVPKLLAIFAMLMLTGSWMFTIINDFSVGLFTDLGKYLG